MEEKISVRKKAYYETVERLAELENDRNEVCLALGYPLDTDIGVIVSHILSLRKEVRESKIDLHESGMTCDSFDCIQCNSVNKPSSRY